jgi:hypothetical protein
MLPQRADYILQLPTADAITLAAIFIFLTPHQF